MSTAIVWFRGNPRLADNTALTPACARHARCRARNAQNRAPTRLRYCRNKCPAHSEARDEAGVEGDNPPAFHELRSLSGALLRDASWAKAQVQELMTHTSESMTQHYLDGHDAPWTAVRMGIALKAIGEEIGRRMNICIPSIRLNY